MLAREQPPHWLLFSTLLHGHWSLSEQNNQSTLRGFNCCKEACLRLFPDAKIGLGTAEFNQSSEQAMLGEQLLRNPLTEHRQLAEQDAIISG